MTKTENLRRGLSIYRDALISTAKQRDEYAVKFNTLHKLFDHFYSQYHCSRRALISSRIDNVELVSLLEKFKPKSNLPDIEIV